MYVTKEGKRLFATKEQTEKAAQLTVAKIKKGEQPSALSNDEIKRSMSITD
jgi:hypothetical protein